MSEARTEVTWSVANRGSYSQPVPDDLILMALSDQVSFEAIYEKYGLREAEVKQVMKRELKIGSYIQWRKRVRRRPHKHRKKFSKGLDPDVG